MSNIVVKDIDWFYERVDGAYALFNLRTFRDIFNAGCYIAGGFIRKLYRDRTTKCISDYFFAGSDVDVFARDEASFNTCYSDVRRRWQLSLHGFAFNDFSGLTSADDNDMFNLLTNGRIMTYGANSSINSRFTTQLVKCHMASPEKMLETFDLVNCQFALDGKRVYFNDEAPGLEDSRVLKAFRMTDLLGQRIKKYHTKHAYASIDESSKQMICDWLSWRLTSNDERRIYEYGQPPKNGLRNVAGLHVIGGQLIKNCNLTTEQLTTLIGKFVANVDVYDYANIKYLEYDDHRRKAYDCLDRSVNVDAATFMLNRDSAATREINVGDIVQLISRPYVSIFEAPISGIITASGIRDGRRVLSLLTTEGDKIDVFDVAVSHVIERT